MVSWIRKRPAALLPARRLGDGIQPLHLSLSGRSGQGTTHCLFAGSFEVVRGAFAEPEGRFMDPKETCSFAASFAGWAMAFSLCTCHFRGGSYWV